MLITPRKSRVPREVRDFGHIYLVEQIAELTGIVKILKKCFPDEYQQILHLAYYQIIEARPMYLQKQWAELSYVNEKLALSSQKISALLKNIGSDCNHRFEFFRAWAKSQKTNKGVFLDLTSFSSHSKLVDFLEWGYNRDGESLPQVNFGVLQGYPTGLPLYYQLYPGSIADVSTLKNIVAQAKDFGVNVQSMVMDRGFYSQSNLDLLHEAQLKYVMPIPFKVKVAQELISKKKQALQSPLNAFYYNGSPMFYTKSVISLGGREHIAHLYLDEKRRTDEMNTLWRRLEELESSVSKGQFFRKPDVCSFMDKQMKWSYTLYQIELLPVGRVQLTRKRNAISRWMNRMGKMILITNDETFNREDILSIYRQKDDVEKLFDIVKNELDVSRLRVSSRDGMEGRLFVTFVALVIYMELSSRMKTAGLFKSYSTAQVFMELKKIRVILMSSGAPYLTEITKKQRNILTDLKLSLPSLPRY